MEKFIPMTSGYCPRLIPMSGDAECNLYSDITGHTSWCSRDSK